MASATIASHTLAITGMSGDVCVSRVTAALKNVSGVTTQSVKVGSATIECDQEGCDAACAAINASGYKAREGVAAATTGSTIALAPEVPSAEHKDRNQSGTPILNPTGNSIGNASSCGNGKPATSSNCNAQPAPFGKSN